MKGPEVWFVLTPPALATLATLLNLRRVSYKAGNATRKDLLGTELPVPCPDVWALTVMSWVSSERYQFWSPLCQKERISIKNKAILFINA